MREMFRDWRYSLRGRRPRRGGSQVLIEPTRSSSTREGEAQGSRGSQGSRAVDRVLSRMGSLSLGPSPSRRKAIVRDPRDAPVQEPAQRSIEESEPLLQPRSSHDPILPGLVPPPLRPLARALPVAPAVPPPPIPEDLVQPPADDNADQDQLKQLENEWNSRPRPQVNPRTGMTEAGRTGLVNDAQAAHVAINYPIRGSSEDLWQVPPQRARSPSPVVRDSPLPDQASHWGGEDEPMDGGGPSGGGDQASDLGVDPVSRWMGDFRDDEYADKDVIDTGKPDNPAESFEKGGVEDVLTFGIGELYGKLEFLVAIASGMTDKRTVFGLDGEEYRPDPHPREKRWISKRLSGLDINPEEYNRNNILFRRYAVRRIVRVMLRNRLQTHEDNMAMHGDYMSESDFSGDERPYWPQIVHRFTVNAPYNPFRTHYENGIIGFRFVDEFHKFCAEQKIDIIKMTSRDIHTVYSRVIECLYDWPSGTHRSQVTSHFEHKLKQSVEDQKSLDKVSLAAADDPLRVDIRGLDWRYRAWSVVEDVSVDGAGMTPDRYNIPPYSFSKVPMKDYLWFGAEVVSPPMPFDNEASLFAIERACGVIRNYFRCHKPMEVSTGLHVHLGHKHGWNLLQAKRFITLWTLSENTLIHLHRKDRGAPRMLKWCGNLIHATCLGQALFHSSEAVRYRQGGCLPRASPSEKKRHQENLTNHVNITNLPANVLEFLRNVWMYPTLSELASAMAGGKDGNDDYLRPSIRVRVSGEKKSDTARMNIPQTIEVRTMQGTLDADHLRQWLTVLRRLIALSFEAPPETFLNAVNSIVEAQKSNQDGVKDILTALNVPPRTLHYFTSRNHRRGDPTTNDVWWVYPDNDMVDWDQPFMAPGHSATHGPQYNFNP
ncbi:hypothetical protein F5Y11DRAFT_345570 [Daldinia sp. FL1419]|nr:hypothetical protein F5Y11DRAFT_345570 [Daldinia sp. FL1419]